MCNIKVKDRVPSKELRERLGIDDIIIDTTAKQVAMAWACAATRRSASADRTARAANFRRDLEAT